MAGVQFAGGYADSYLLQFENKAIIYLESPNGMAGFNYPSHDAKLSGLILPDGLWPGLSYFPATGKISKFTIKIESGEGDLNLPAFQDDLTIYIKQ